MGKSLLKKEAIIDFTCGGNFKTFNNNVIKYLIKNKTKKYVHILDSIYPIDKLSRSIYEIKDHVNLSGFNPLKGPRFISLTDIYASRSGITVCALKEGVYLNKKEKRILLSGKVKAYCYNLVPTVIFAASLGLKTKATGVVK